MTGLRASRWYRWTFKIYEHWGHGSVVHHWVSSWMFLPRPRLGSHLGSRYLDGVSLFTLNHEQYNALLLCNCTSIHSCRDCVQRSLAFYLYSLMRSSLRIVRPKNALSQLLHLEHAYFASRVRSISHISFSKHCHTRPSPIPTSNLPFAPLHKSGNAHFLRPSSYARVASLAASRLPLFKHFSTNHTSHIMAESHALHSRPGSGSTKVLTNTMEKPELDNRSYRVIQLPNKLEALLVHDPDTDKASAAMDVNIGSFSDSPDLPGMAHAVEHLLFMGTEKVRA